MFCPKCAAQNQDDAKYCRTCGADISLVPQALTGAPAKKADEDESRQRSRPHRGERPTVESGVLSLFMGFAFLFVSLALSQRGSADNWWFYMLIPAFGCLGKGVSTLIRLREGRRTAAPATYAQDTTRLDQPPRASALPPRETGEIIAPPPSVTEATTRHLGVPVERRPKDV